MRMKPTGHKSALALGLALGLVAMVGCLGHKQAGGGVPGGLGECQVFERIKLGMTRVQVEKAVGMPVAQFTNRAYYGKPPRIQAWESARTPYSIVVVYSTNKVVAYKAFDNGTKNVIEGAIP